MSTSRLSGSGQNLLFIEQKEDGTKEEGSRIHVLRLLSLPPFHRLPAYHPALQTNTLPLPFSARPGTNLLNSQTVAIKFEPRKSDAPQLRDEYRSYKILSGCSASRRLLFASDGGLLLGV